MPKQVILRHKKLKFTFLLFTSGQFRIMGKCNSYSTIMNFLNDISSIYTSIESLPTIVSQTITLQIDQTLCPINLHKLIDQCSDDPHITFEGERFPAITFTHWKPLHVNLFHTGKLIIMGRDSSIHKDKIEDWMYIQLLCFSLF